MALPPPKKPFPPKKPAPGFTKPKKKGVEEDEEEVDPSASSASAEPDEDEVDPEVGEAEVDGAAEEEADEEDEEEKDNASASDAPPDQMKGAKPNPLRRWAADLASKLKDK